MKSDSGHVNTWPFLWQLFCCCCVTSSLCQSSICNVIIVINIIFLFCLDVFLLLFLFSAADCRLHIIGPLKRIPTKTKTTIIIIIIIAINSMDNISVDGREKKKQDSWSWLWHSNDFCLISENVSICLRIKYLSLSRTYRVSLTHNIHFMCLFCSVVVTIQPNKFDEFFFLWIIGKHYAAFGGEKRSLASLRSLSQFRLVSFSFFLTISHQIVAQHVNIDSKILRKHDTKRKRRECMFTSYSPPTPLPRSFVVRCACGVCAQYVKNQRKLTCMRRIKRTMYCMCVSVY